MNSREESRDGGGNQPPPKMINLDQSLGLVNVYRCKCGWELVTRDVDKGTTPFLIACRRCPDFAESRFYKVDQSLEHSAEWRKAMTPGEGYEKDPDMIRHRDAGGLFLHYLDGSKSGLRRIPKDRVEVHGNWLGAPPRRSKGFKQLKKGLYK